MLTRYLLHHLAPAFLRSELRRITQKLLRKARRVDEQVVTLEPPAGSPRGDVLFSYVIDPFLLRPGQAIPTTHTHFWESRTMARTFVELGFRVDAISWTNLGFVPPRDYDFIIDVRLNLERLAPLQPSAVCVLHTDTAHYTCNNPAQERRLQALAKRRGTAIRPQRMLPSNRAAESADCITLLGNEFTQGTYRFAGKPIFRIPISVPFTYPWPEGKDFAAVRRRFLWFGSGGLVHKGLDLVLEAFAGMPDFHLTVCGPIRRERDFEREYFRELYQTPNIRTLGWVDVGAPEFQQLARECLGVVYPSCAEGGGGSVVTCMHAGLIPVVNDEVSVDVDASRGMPLAECSIEQIRETVAELAERGARELEERARNAWSFARAHHTKDRFREEYRRFAASLVDGSWRQAQEARTDDD